MPAVYDHLRKQYEEELFHIEVNITDEEKKKQEIELLRDKYHDKLGGRVSSVSIGGALSSNSIMKWLKYIFWDSSIVDSYGSTEVGNITVGHKINPQVDVRLIDWGVIILNLFFYYFPFTYNIFFIINGIELQIY